MQSLQEYHSTLVEIVTGCIINGILGRNVTIALMRKLKAMIMENKILPGEENSAYCCIILKSGKGDC